MKTTEQVDEPDKNVPNPTGKGGFGDNPQNRNPGGWKKEESISYQYNMLMRLTVDEFKKWLEDNPEKSRTMAQEMAYQAMLKARKELNYLKEITDRVEGKPRQTIDQNVTVDPVKEILKGYGLDVGEDQASEGTTPKEQT